MNRGYTENDCLEFVRQHLNSSNSPTDVISALITSVTPNEDLSKFPDFVCENGFIEHFEVTATKEDKNGSEMRQHDFKINKRIKNLGQFISEENGFGYESFVAIEPPSSYENFVLSFKKNLEHHIQSLKKYAECKSYMCGTFMVDNRRNVSLQMREVCKGEHYEGLYKLSLDKKLLSYIQSLPLRPDYIIFVYRNGFEVINCNCISEHIENVKHHVDIMASNSVAHLHSAGPIGGLWIPTICGRQ